MNFKRKPQEEEELEGQMSFLEHLDELRRRLVRSILFILVAFMACFYFSDKIFNFLAVPVQRELSYAIQNKVESGETFTTLKDGDRARFIFNQKTNLGSVVIPVGASVESRIAQCEETKLCVLTEEDLIIN